MALKPILSADEFGKLPEALQSAYIEDGDGYQLDVEGGLGEDVTALKNALERQKAAARDAKTAGSEQAKQLQSMQALLEGLGGEEGAAKLKELQDKLAKDELLRAMSEGNLEIVSNKLLSRNNADWQKKYGGIEQKLNEATEALKAKDQQLTRLVVDGEIQRAATGVLVPSAISDAVLLGSLNWSVDENGKPVMRVNDELQLGKDGKPLGVSEWLNGLADDHPHWFPGSTGGGTSGGRSNGAGRQPWQLTRDEANSMENVRRATEAARKAGKAGYETIEG